MAEIQGTTLEGYQLEFSQAYAEFQETLESSSDRGASSGAFKAFATQMESFAKSVFGNKNISPDMRRQQLNEINLSEISGFTVGELIALLNLLPESIQIALPSGSYLGTVREVITNINKTIEQRADIFNHVVETSPSGQVSRNGLAKIISQNMYPVTSAFGIRSLVLDQLMADPLVEEINQRTPAKPISPILDANEDRPALEELITNFKLEFDNFKKYMERDLVGLHYHGSYERIMKDFPRKLVDFASNILETDTLGYEQRIEILERFNLADIRGLSIVDLIELFGNVGNTTISLVKTDYGLAPIYMQETMKALDIVQKSMGVIISKAIKESTTGKLEVESLNKVLSEGRYRITKAFGIRSVVINDLLEIYKQTPSFRGEADIIDVPLAIPVVKDYMLKLRQEFEGFKRSPNQDTKELASAIREVAEKATGKNEAEQLLNIINLSEIEGFDIEALIKLLREVGGEVKIFETSNKFDEVEVIYVADVIKSLEKLQSGLGNIIMRALSESRSDQLDSRSLYSIVLAEGYKIPAILGMNTIVINGILSKYNRAKGE